MLTTCNMIRAPYREVQWKAIIATNNPSVVSYVAGRFADKTKVPFADESVYSLRYLAE
ncbi:MAG: hypothetical protein FWD57_15130 [Polyangiaceae bacterium]|nr:hypothetical protein [Polyangiaceae bacterium]